MILDISPPPLNFITVDGVLSFDRADLNLTAQYIWIRAGALNVCGPHIIEDFDVDVWRRVTRRIRLLSGRSF